MALEIKAKFEKVDDTIIITDLTGLYNNDTTDPHYNITGWQDISTAAISAATAAVLAISVPDPITLSPVATPTTFNLYNTLPNYLYNSKTLDQAGVDGVYYFTFAVTVTGKGLYKFSQYKLFTPIADCCIQQLSDKSIYNAKAQKAFSDAFDIWTTMKYSACCGEMNQAIAQLKKLQRICRKAGCDTCC